MNDNMLSEKDTKAVLGILVEQLGVPEEQITPDASLMEDLGADSLDIAEITLAVEERFDLSTSKMHNNRQHCMKNPVSFGTKLHFACAPITSHFFMLLARGQNRHFD